MSDPKTTADALADLAREARGLANTAESMSRLAAVGGNPEQLRGLANLGKRLQTSIARLTGGAAVSVPAPAPAPSTGLRPTSVPGVTQAAKALLAQRAAPPHPVQPAPAKSRVDRVFDLTGRVSTAQPVSPRVAAALDRHFGTEPKRAA